jgi:hypothetical protein
VETAAIVAEAVAAELAELEAGAADGVSVTAEPPSLGAELAEAEASGADEATVTAAQPAQPAQAADQPTVESEAIVLEPEEPEAHEQPTVESEAIVLDADDQPTAESDAVSPWSPTRPPLAATDMAGAFARHPAFAVENEPVADALPPIAEALALAAASERAAADRLAAHQPPEVAFRPAPEPDRPAALSATPCADGRAPRRRLAQGGLLIGLLLAIARFLLGRR